MVISTIKNQIEFVLSKFPSIFIKILDLKGNPNLEKNLYLKLIKNSDCVFDIGANVGYYTLLFSHLTGNTGEIHAFEAVPPTYEILKKNIANKAKYKNHYLNNYAVNDNELSGQIEMNVPEDDFGQASLLQQDSGSWKNAKKITKYQCQSITLDSYLNQLTSQGKDLQKLNFIKCDVEGAELLVLKGGKKTIGTYSPIIFVEVCHDWTRKFNYQPDEIIDFLKEFGYSHFYLVDRNIRKILNKHDVSEDSLKSSSNMLCLISNVHQKQITALRDLQNEDT